MKNILVIFKKEINLRLSIEAANVLLDLNLSNSLKNNIIKFSITIFKFS